MICFLTQHRHESGLSILHRPETHDLSMQPDVVVSGWEVQSHRAGGDWQSGTVPTGKEQLVRPAPEQLQRAGAQRQPGSQHQSDQVTTIRESQALDWASLHICSTTNVGILHRCIVRPVSYFTRYIYIAALGQHLQTNFDKAEAQSWAAERGSQQSRRQRHQGKRRWKKR